MKASKRPYDGPQVIRVTTKHLDQQWSWEAIVFQSTTAFRAKYIMNGTERFPNRRTALADLQKVLDGIGLGKAPAP